MSLYIIKIFKSWGTRDPERRWSNTYEIESTALTPAGLGQAVEDISEAEKIIHYDGVNFLSATVSTWQEDGTPYNPFSFTTVTLSGNGSRGNSTTDQTLDGNVCYQVNFIPELGRAGRRYYRGCLSEADVQPGGDLRFNLSNASPLFPTGAKMVAFRAALDPYLATGMVGDTIVLVGQGNEGIVGREVVSVATGGVVVNKRNHKYFDRV